jgi:hypothetical protein
MISPHLSPRRAPLDVTPCVLLCLWYSDHPELSEALCEEIMTRQLELHDKVSVRICDVCVQRVNPGRGQLNRSAANCAARGPSSLPVAMICTL